MPEAGRTVRVNHSGRSAAGMRSRYVQTASRPGYPSARSANAVLAVPQSAREQQYPSKRSASTRVRPQVKRQQATSKPALPRQSKSKVLARHAIKHKPPVRKAGRFINIRFSVIFLWIIALFVGAGAFQGYMVLRNNLDGRPTVLSKNTDEADFVSQSSENEVSPEVLAGYEVDADLPRVLTMQRIQVSSRVKRLITRSNGELTYPRNIHDVGWYEGSVKPGEPGVSLLVGHVHGDTKPGIFSRLNNVREGDVVEIERGDGLKLNFSVVNIESFEQDGFKLEQALRSFDHEKPALHLLTHSGRFDVRTNKYEKRLLVRALLQ